MRSRPFDFVFAAAGRVFFSLVPPHVRLCVRACVRASVRACVRRATGAAALGQVVLGVAHLGGTF